MTTNVVTGASVDAGFIAGAQFYVTPTPAQFVEGPAWIDFVSAIRGDSLLNLAFPGDMAADQTRAIYGVTPAAGMRALLCNWSVNDICWNRKDADKRANTGAIATAMLYWFGAGTRTIAQDASITYSGTWANSPVNAMGKYSSSIGATASFGFDGTYFVIGTQLQDGNPGSFKVTIDGIDYGPFLNQGQNGKSVSTKNSLTYHTPGCYFGTNPIPCWAYAGIVISGLSAGHHSAIITVLSGSSGTVYFDWFGQGSSGLPIYLLPSTRQTPAGYALNCVGFGNPDPAPDDTDAALYASMFAAIVSQAQTNGLNAHILDAGTNALDPTDASLFQFDGLHLSKKGYGVYSAAINGALP